ncbi:hypothetical protein RHMOL_Rhmol12G0124100 [Rhododendron molle]|uniref:Uncharacterized protein n=1 Tax=Rhododendron molle TaxID=49168 RepID=A0ACC0LIU7_RHOML|nr:hypothetical protein RHMOL_Rhmol12G0124100 [Rhododendron molle]
MRGPKPAQVHFFNVPLELWTGPGLSYVASFVGRPLYADQLTESGQRLSFTKLCVRVDCSSPLPSSFDLKYANGDMVEIRGPEAVKTHVNLGKNVAPSHIEWQAVGTLRKDTHGSICYQPPPSLQIASASTSKPIATSTNLDTGTSPVIALPHPLTEHAGSPFSILERSSLVEAIVSPTIPKAPSKRSSANKFAAFDGVALWDDVAAEMTSMNVVLPDVLFDAPHIGGDVFVVEIAEDFSVVPPQSTTLPLGSGSKRPGEGRR